MLMTALNNHTPKEVRKALAADWNTVKPLKGGTAGTEPGVFEEAESQRLVNCCAGNFRDLVMFCLGTGARPASEAAKMKVRDIDTRTATWTVREGKTGTRVTYLTKAMVDLLEAVTAGKAQDEFVFTRDDGKPWNRFDMQRPFQAAVARAKLDPEASPYWLRHTHISLQLLNGAIPALVAQNTGTSLTMLQRTYATFLGQDMTAMLERTSTAYERPESNVVTLK